MLPLVDRPPTRLLATWMIAKAAGGGTCEFTGKMFGANDLLTKADTVNVDVPKGASITFSPSDLAKLLKHRETAEDREADAFKAMTIAEEAVFKRNIDTATRRRLASEGKALPNLSYPIENAEDLGNAATLARSGHGDVGAARKLISRRAKELGVANPLDTDDTEKAEDVDAAKNTPAETPAADVVKDDSAPQLHHNDGEDDDTDSDADAMDKAASPGPGPRRGQEAEDPVPQVQVDGQAQGEVLRQVRCGHDRREKASKPTPGDGVTGEHVEPAPEHREPDGPAIEALEHDARPAHRPRLQRQGRRG